MKKKKNSFQNEKDIQIDNAQEISSSDGKRSKENSGQKVVKPLSNEAELDNKSNKLDGSEFEESSNNFRLEPSESKDSSNSNNSPDRSDFNKPADLPDLNKPKRAFLVRILTGTIRFLGSLPIALVLLTLPAVLLGWATFIEMGFGTPVAQYIVYSTNWFYLLLGLLGLNIFFSCLTRFPWKTRHLPFLVAHIGIIILLVGCWLTAKQGVEAKFTISEGMSKSEAIAHSRWLFKIDLQKNAPSSSGTNSSADLKQSGTNSRESAQSSRETITIPFSGGPFNWSDFSKENWRKNIIDSKKGAKVGPHLWGVRLLALMNEHPKSPFILYNKDGLSIEILEYYTNSDFHPTGPLRLNLRRTGQNQSTEVTLSFPENRESATANSVSRRGLRRSLADGTRVVYILADSVREFDGILNTLPDNSDKESLSQLVLNCRGELFRFDLKTMKLPLELGKTGLRVVDFRITPTLVADLETLQGWSAVMQIEDQFGHSEELQIHSELTERSTFSARFGITGAIWQTATKENQQVRYGRHWNSELGKPRLEIIQSPDRRVGYRTWNGAGYVASGLFDLTNIDDDCLKSGVVSADPKSGFDSIELIRFCPSDEAGVRLTSTPFQKDFANEFYAKVRVRVTLDGETETFLTRTIPKDSALTAQQTEFLTKRIYSKDRNASIQLTNQLIQTGFSIYVRRFEPSYVPGSTTPSSFSSTVDYLPGKDFPNLEKKSNIVIRMNQPGVFYDPLIHRNWHVYQDSFRGPFLPGSEQFDSVVKGSNLQGETIPREKIYSTVLSINNDPGRGLKYFGSLLIVLGTAMLIYRNRKKNKTVVGRSTIVGILFVALIFGFGMNTPSFAEEAPSSAVQTVRANQYVANDWTAWRLLPVYSDGRIMPLNTFARIKVREICGSVRPELRIRSIDLQRLEGEEVVNFPPLSAYLNEQEKQYTADEKQKLTDWYNEKRTDALKKQHLIAARIRSLFPNGIRRFEAYELLFSWLAEPEIWDGIPFLYDEKGIVARFLTESDKSNSESPTFLAPMQLDGTDRYSKQMDRILQGTPGEYKSKNDLKKTDALDLALAQIEERYSRFRAITFNPATGVSPLIRYYLDNQLLYPTEQERQSLLEQLDLSVRRLEAFLRAEPKNRETTPFDNKDFLLCQKTPMAGNETRSEKREILLIIRNIHLVARASEEYPLLMNNRLFERLYSELLTAFKTLEEHKKKVFETGSLSEPYRRELLVVCSLTERTLYVLEQAYLGLTDTCSYEMRKRGGSDRLAEHELADGTRTIRALPAAALNINETGTMRVLPVISELRGSMKEEQSAPWLSFQTVVNGPDEIYRRFVDPSFPVPTDSDNKKRGNGISPTRREAAAFQLAVENWFGFSVLSEENRQTVSGTAKAQEFFRALDSFVDSLRTTASRTSKVRHDFLRKRLHELGEADYSDTIFKKIDYPKPNSLNAEYFYYRLNPFYWTWFYCLLALIFLIPSCLFGLVRILRNRASSEKREPIRQSNRGNTKKTTDSNSASNCEKRKSNRLEIFSFYAGLFFLILSAAVTFLGGAIRAWITGWAPVTNMFETVILLVFLVTCFSIYFVFLPIIRDPFAYVWERSSLKNALASFKGRCSTVEADSTTGTNLGQGRQFFAILTIVLRLILMLLTGYAVIWICYNEYADKLGLWGALTASFARQSFLDRFAVGTTLLVLVWLIPRFIMAIFFVLATPKKIFNNEVSSVRLWERKLWPVLGAAAALAIGYWTYTNTSEFNPQIRPLAAVLRSNFWLTIHVFAIIISYALATLAWFVSAVMLAVYLFGRYRIGSDPDPEFCERLEPMLLGLIRNVVLFLTVGTILGARWADFSWGRFWSWDPKEVWALVTLLIYLVILHGRKARLYSRFGLTIGSVFGAFAIIMTWYGLSFVFGGGGRHSYVTGESTKTVVLCLLLVSNIVLMIPPAIVYKIKSRRKRSESEKEEAIDPNGTGAKEK